MTTLDDIRVMTDEEMNEAIAIEVMGWHLLVGDYRDFYIKDHRFMYPVDDWNPTQDLNQCYEAEETIYQKGLANEYILSLGLLVKLSEWGIIHVTARQRCEAMLATVRGVK